MKLKIIFIAIGIALSAIEMPSAGHPREKIDPTLPILAEWLTGSFSNAEQVAGDSTFLNIRVTISPIWKHFSSGIWFYVEEAIAGHEARPYRQFIYFLTRTDDSTFRCDVYSLPNPALFAGAGNREKFLTDISPDSLDLQKGCAIILKFDGQAFVGGTLGNDCTSGLKGTAYSTSEVRLNERQLYIRIRGFNSAGIQAWGAETGGYIFNKIK